MLVRLGHKRNDSLTARFRYLRVLLFKKGREHGTKGPEESRQLLVVWVNIHELIFLAGLQIDR